MSDYTPSALILHRYARVLVNFALNSGKGIKKGDVVRLSVAESAKPLYIELRNQVLRSGGHVLTNYLPDDVARRGYELASREQLRFFPAAYARGIVNQQDHSIHIISDTNLHELEGIDPQKIMTRSQAYKPLKDWQDAKENKGKYTWTLALYGTPAMAKEAKLSLASYWDQIIKACFLDYSDPLAKWRQVFTRNSRILKQLNALKIDRMHIEGERVNLWVKLGPGRKWLGGSGRNIPSFECFISPDWRGTEGHIEFDQPLYRYGSMITGIKLDFKRGVVVGSSAAKNQSVLKAMLATTGANKVGEFSLTDTRLSRIDKFMAQTLFDENISGPFGNTHIALGSAYKDSYPTNPSKVSEATWKKLGYNDSVVHTDIISTADRTVTAYLADKTSKIIYKQGKFTL